MEGCGKTYTVAKFLQIHKNKYDNIFWIVASNQVFENDVFNEK